MADAQFRAVYRGWRVGAAHGVAEGSDGPALPPPPAAPGTAAAGAAATTAELVDSRASLDGLDLVTPTPETAHRQLELAGRRSPEDEAIGWVPPVGGCGDPCAGDGEGEAGEPEADEQEYFPAPPRLSARRSLKDVMADDLRSDICDRVARILASGSATTHVPAPDEEDTTLVVVNHLYEPALERARDHFAALPDRYCFTTTAEDVVVNLRLMADAARNPGAVRIHAAPLVHNSGAAPVPRTFVVTAAFCDRPGVLNHITRCLTQVPVRIQDADVMTSSDGVALDRFVVVGDEACTAEQLLAVEQALGPSPGAGGRAPDTLDTTDDSSGDSDGGTLRMRDLRLGARLRESEEGAVALYEAEWAGIGVLAKTLSLRGSQLPAEAADELLAEFAQEAEVVSRLRHRNLLASFGAAVGSARAAIVYERLNGETLRARIVAGGGGPLPAEDAVRFALDVAEGMLCMHAQGFVHRDLRSETLCFDEAGVLKVTEFGLACAAADDGDLTGETGTYRWMAPEVVRHEPYGRPADVYSFGMVLWEMLAGERPFEALSARDAALAVAGDGLRPEIPDDAPPLLARLVDECWAEDPAARPTFEEVIPRLSRV